MNAAIESLKLALECLPPETLDEVIGDLKYRGQAVWLIDKRARDLDDENGEAVAFLFNLGVMPEVRLAATIKVALVRLYKLTKGIE